VNDYQENVKIRAATFADELTAICAELPGGWCLVPVEDECFTGSWRTLSNADGSRELWAQKYNGRFEFSATRWPEYTDEKGSKEYCRPSNLWNPRANAPKTTAAANREPAAIAKQIKSRLFADYEALYARCEESAAETQKYHDKTADALKRLAEATGNEYKPDGYSKSFYVQDMPGDTLRVEFRSVGDCELNLSTDEVIPVIALIRELRHE